MSYGKLYIIPTPIGNMADITYRAVELLKNLHIVYAEDTRVSSKIFRHYSIDTSLRSYHTYNEKNRTEEILNRLKSGQDVGLISDAGTPGISDPSYLIIKSCIDEGILFECLPGATAFVPAILLSGMPNHHFSFYGFLPQKKGRKKSLETILEDTKTSILYESPYRIVKLLKEISELDSPDRNVSVSREITKMFEETVRGKCSDVLKHFEQKKPKGEFVIVIEGSRK